METERTLARMNVPDWGLNATLQTYDATLNSDQQIVESIRAACEKCGDVGILSPSTGRGKTHLAIGAMGLSWYLNIIKTETRFKYGFISGWTDKEADELFKDKYNITFDEAPDEQRKEGVKFMRDNPKLETIYIREQAESYHFVRADFMSHQLEKAGFKFEELYNQYTSYSCLCLDELGRNLERGDRLELTQMVIYELYDKGKQLIFTSPLTKAGLINLFDGSIIDRMSEGLMIELPAGKSYRQNRKD